MDNVIKYCLRIADNSLILSHRLGAYSSNGPFLAEDLAITNVALDHIGLAESMLNYVASISEKNISGDDLAFKRPEQEYFNCQLVEQPNIDFAYVMARQFFMDVFNVLFFTGLQSSKNEFLSGLAEKSLKEVTYHQRRSSEWMIRLGIGTEESKDRIQKATNNLWIYTDELFEMDLIDLKMVDEGVGIHLAPLRQKWKSKVIEVLDRANLGTPNHLYVISGGRSGQHSEHMGHLLSEMQYLNSKYPDADW